MADAVHTAVNKNKYSIEALETLSFGTIFFYSAMSITKPAVSSAYQTSQRCATYLEQSYFSVNLVSRQSFA
jgi:hypothetical protein